LASNDADATGAARKQSGSRFWFQLTFADDEGLLESIRIWGDTMKAYEFAIKTTSEGRLELPEALLRVLPANQVIRTIILIEEKAEADDLAWSRLTVEQFLAGYSEADAIYDRI
jgi:hypothetical protein